MQPKKGNGATVSDVLCNSKKNLTMEALPHLSWQLQLVAEAQAATAGDFILPLFLSIFQDFLHIYQPKGFHVP
jgi:hypothetical protein